MSEQEHGHLNAFLHVHTREAHDIAALALQALAVGKARVRKDEDVAVFNRKHRFASLESLSIFTALLRLVTSRTVGHHQIRGRACLVTQPIWRMSPPKKTFQPHSKESLAAFCDGHPGRGNRCPRSSHTGLSRCSHRQAA